MVRATILVVSTILISAVYLHLSEPSTEDPRSFEVVNMDVGARRTRLTAREQVTDIDFLLKAMQELYAGQKISPSRFAEFAHSLRLFQREISGPIQTEKFREILQHRLNQLEDGHLSLISWYELKARSPKNELALASNFRSPASDDSRESVEIRRTGSRNIYLFHMPTFLRQEVSDGAKISQSVEASLSGADAMIFDLRGNTGGFQFIALEIAAKLWGKPYRDGSLIQYFPQPIKETGNLGGPFAVALSKNSAIIQDSQYGRSLQKKIGQNFFERLLTYNEFNYGSLAKKYWVDEYDYPPDSTFEENHFADGFADLAEKGFTKPIVVIVDSDCASSCELLLESLETHPHVVTIGQTTKGAVQFGNIYDLVLPKSHLVLGLPTEYKIYHDGRSPEGHGYKPQIHLKPGNDPIAVAEKLIESRLETAPKTKKGPRTGAL